MNDKPNALCHYVAELADDGLVSPHQLVDMVELGGPQALALPVSVIGLDETMPVAVLLAGLSHPACPPFDPEAKIVRIDPKAIKSAKAFLAQGQQAIAV